MQCTSALVLPVVCCEEPAWRDPGSKISFHQVWTKAADGVGVKCAFSLHPPVPAPLPLVPASPLPQPLYPLQPAVHGMFAISSKSLIVFFLWWRQERKTKKNNGSLEGVWFLNFKASSLKYNSLRGNKLWADHRSNMQYWWPASPVVTAAVIVSN